MLGRPSRYTLYSEPSFRLPLEFSLLQKDFMILQKSRRKEDHIQSAQLIWSCVVALSLGIAAIFHLGLPRNALIEPDRAPAAQFKSAEPAVAIPGPLYGDS